MGDAVYAIPSFLGGEISDFAQGRFDKPDYRVSLNICLNSFPVEIGAWTRRPGTMHAGPTRGGAAGRTIKFDFEQAAAVTLEFTDGYMRFRSGAALLSTNDEQAIVSISSADPAVVETAAHGWTGTISVIFDGLGENNPLLQGRVFTGAVTSGTQFTLTDPLTGAAINGSTLGTFVSGTVRRVQELATLYTGTSWENVRPVQAETTDVLLCPLIPPQVLTVETLPSEGIEPQFEIASAVFIDGPYLDPFINGVQAVPNAVSGIINLTLSFAAYVSTKAYAEGTFVTYSGINYVSLIDQNVGNTPSTSLSAWSQTSAAAAINDGRGFLGTDTGRLVRLLSEPPAFNPATTYSAGNVVTYNPSGEPGASTYWQAKTTTTGTPPGYDLSNWEIIPSGPAVWTWGRITGLSNVIDRLLPGSIAIGDMTEFNGITAPFDGNFSKAVNQSAAETITGGSVITGGTVSVSSYAGKFFGAGPQQIQQATIYPTLDRGFGFAEFVVGGVLTSFLATFTLNLRGKATAPASPSDGALLGSTSFGGSSVTTTIVSNDQTTGWNYVWIELVISSTLTSGFATSYRIGSSIAQISFFNPTSSSSSGAGCSVEILGPPLVDTTPIATWRLGVYSNTTGWPTCGTYNEGRIWLGGAVANRFDASVSNGISGNTLNFSPTNQFGVVAASNALNYTLNSDGVNPMFWMRPDLQGVVIGTQQGEWLVQAPTTGPIAPTNIAARRMTKHGSANVDPVRTEHANLFVKRYGRKLMEYFADAYSGKFSAPNLADKAGHIVSAGIIELAYTEAVTPIVWGRDGDNALFGMTYRRTAIATAQPPDFYAWHRHTLGSGRTVESISAGPSVGGDLDTVTLVTNDADTGIRHVEVLTDAPDENTELADAWFLDNAVEPSSAIVDLTPIDPTAPYGGVTLNGLWHLNGETVQVFASGLDCGDRGTASSPGYFTDFLVTDGSCFVPFGDGIDAGCGRGLFTPEFLAANPRVVVGFTYNSDGQLVRPIAPADTGARNGPALGKTRRNHQYSVLVSNTLGLSFGGTFAVARPAQFRKANGNPIDQLTMFSGVHHDTLSDDYSYDGMVAWRVTRPWPANIVAISGNVQTQDR
jgi:hypothetical protein